MAEIAAKKDSKNILDKAVDAVQNFQPDKSLFAKGMDAVQKHVLPTTNAYHIDVGIAGNVFGLDKLHTTLAHSDKFTSYAETMESGFDELTLENVLGSTDQYGRERELSELILQDYGGNILHSEPIIRSEGNAISEYDIAKNTYKKLKNNEPITQVEGDAFDAWALKIKSANENAKMEKDNLVAIKGYDKDGSMLPEMVAAARMWFTPEYNLAVNRKSLDEHLVGNMGLEKNVTLRRLLRDNFNTGHPVVEVVTRTGDWLSGLGDVLFPYRYAVGDALQNAWNQSETWGEFWTVMGESKDRRRMARKNYLDAIDNNIGINLANVDMWNDWIKDRWLEENNPDDWKLVEDELTLNEEQARSLSDFSTKELGWFEGALAFTLENATGSVLFGTAGRWGARGYQFIMPKWMGGVRGRRISNVEEFTKLENEKLTFRVGKNGNTLFRASTVSDFADYKIKQQLSSNKAGEMLQRLFTWPFIRQRGRIQDAVTRVRDIGNTPSMLPWGQGNTLKTNLYNARKKIIKLQDNSKNLNAAQYKIEWKKATNELDQATNEWIAELHKNGATKLGMTKDEMLAIFGDEITPAIAQSIVMNIFEDKMDSGPTEMAGAGVNILFALGTHKGIVWGADNIIDKVPYVNDGVHFMKEFIDDSMILSKYGLRNIGFRAILDTEIRDLEKQLMKSGAKGWKEKGERFTRDEYNSLIAMKKRLGGLGPEVVDWLDNQFEIVNKQYDSMLKLMPDGPEKEKIKEALKLSFAQMSNITYFGAMGRKLLMQLSEHDIMKMNDRFKAAVQTQFNNSQLISAQTEVLENVRKILDSPAVAGFENPEAVVRLREWVNMQQDALTNIQKDFDIAQAEIKEQHNFITDWISDDVNWRTLGEDEVDKLISDNLDVESLLNPEVAKNVVIAVNSLSANKKSISTSLNSAIKHLDNVQINTFDSAIASDQIMDTARAAIINFKYNKILLSKRANELYAPLDNIKNDKGMPVEIPGGDLFQKFIDQDLVTSGDADMLSRFTRNSFFSQSPEGKTFFRSSNRAAERILIKQMLFEDPDTRVINPKIIDKINASLGEFDEPVPYGVTFDQVDQQKYWRMASNMLKEMHTNPSIINPIKKHYKIPVGDELSPLQIYQYYTQVKKIKLPQVSFTLRELEDFRLYARDRKNYLQIKSPGHKDTNAWIETENTLTKFIDNNARDITVEMPDGNKTDGLSYMEWIRTSYELEIANSKLDNSSWASYIKAIEDDPYSPIRVSATDDIIRKNVNGKEITFGVPRFDANVVLNTALGKDFLKKMFEGNPATKQRMLNKTREEMVRMWGTAVYPKWAARPDGKLDPNIFTQDFIKAMPEYDDWVRGFENLDSADVLREGGVERYVILQLKNKLRNETRHVIDMNTEVGQDAFRLMQNTYGILINELRHQGRLYGGLTENNVQSILKGKVTLSGKGGPTSAEAATAPYDMRSAFTTDNGADGQQQWVFAQELLSVPVIKQGDTEPSLTRIKNLDLIWAAETDIRNVIQTSEKAAIEFNSVIRNTNTQIRRGASAAKIDKEYEDEFKAGYMEFLKVNDDISFVKRYIGEMKKPPSDQNTIKANLNVYTERVIKNQIELRTAELEKIKTLGIKKADDTYRKPTEKELEIATVNANPEKIKAEVHGSLRNLMWGGIRRMAGTRAVEGMDYNGRPFTGTTIGEPHVALEILERPDVQELFFSYGVDQDHMDHMLAITGHLVLVDNFNRGSLGFNINDPRYTDTGIISRSFNYARGLVSKEYLAVEAGFRIMRNKNLRMMNWLLNDKEGAELINKMLNSPKKFEDWEAVTLFERMQAWIARELGHRGEMLTEYEWDATMQEVQDEYNELQDNMEAASKPNIQAFQQPWQYEATTGTNLPRAG